MSNRYNSEVISARIILVLKWWLNKTGSNAFIDGATILLIYHFITEQICAIISISEITQNDIAPHFYF